MGLLTRHLRFAGLPKPKYFLYVMSLRTGTELIALTFALNKVTGFYGFLAIATGYHLSPVQFSLYVYSLIALGLIVYLAPHIRKASPFQNLVLAHFYLVDTIVNIAYTALFSTTWFLLLTKNSLSGLGGSTISSTSGFVSASASANASHVAVVASTAAGFAGNQRNGITASISDVNKTVPRGDGVTVLNAESVTSIIMVAILTLVRLYFALIVFSYARQVIRNYVSLAAIRNYGYNVPQTPVSATGEEPDTYEPMNPFSVTSELGVGWYGKFARFLIDLNRGYWLGNEEEEQYVGQSVGWMKFARRSRSARTSANPSAGSSWEMGVPSGLAANSNSNSNKTAPTLNAVIGTSERERRRRSGTGPPLPYLLEGVTPLAEQGPVVVHVNAPTVPPNRGHGHQRGTAGEEH